MALNVGALIRPSSALVHRRRHDADRRSRRQRRHATSASRRRCSARRPARAMCGTQATRSLGSQLTYGLGLSYAVVPQKFDLLGEAFGYADVTGSRRRSPLEGLLAIKVYLARNSYFELGGGAGLLPASLARRHDRLAPVPRLPRLHLRAVDRRPRRRRLQGRRRQVPGRSRGLRRLRGRGRLPRSRQRQGRHPRRRRQVPERAGDQERLRGRGRLPRLARRRSRRRRHPRSTSTSAPTIPRTRTASRTRTAAPIPTTTRTASSTSTTCARTIPRTRTASRTRTAAPIPTTTRTASSTRTTSARTSRRPTTASRTRTAAPTRGSVIMRKGKLEILDKIYFETDKAIIKPISFPILDAVAATLKGNPQIMLVEIQGHADERGDDDYNLRLTEDRAARGQDVPHRARRRGRAACRRTATARPSRSAPQHNEDCWSQEPPRRVRHPAAHRLRPAGRMIPLVILAPLLQLLSVGPRRLARRRGAGEEAPFCRRDSVRAHRQGRLQLLERDGGVL